MNKMQSVERYFQFVTWCVRRATRLLAIIFLCISGSATLYAGDGSIDPATGNMEFEINFRYPPTSQKIDDAKSALTLMSQMICDATDGQIKVSDIRLTGGEKEEDKAAFWFYPTAFRSGGSIANDGSSLNTLGSHLGLSAGSQFRADVLAHEMGHHAFGLGEQYEEQRRWGGCGIGPGFEYAEIDEQNHTLMQQSGTAKCVGGVVGGGLLGDGDWCRWDAECASNSCEPWLMSEFSVQINHDRVRGETAFPVVTATSNIEFYGWLTEGAPTQVFDGTDWGTAQATSSAQRDVEVLDETGRVPGLELTFFATRTGVRQWTISAAIDDGLVGGTDGDLNLIEQWNIDFSADNSLNTVSEVPAELVVTGLTSGAADITINLDFGTPGEPDWQNDVLISWPLGDSYFWLNVDGSPFCDMAYVSGGWSSVSKKWETAEQSHRHPGPPPLSDWETIAENYPFIVPPAGLPVAPPPASCLIAPNFVEDVIGSDQVLLIIDRSGSMAWSSSSSTDEVCDNGVDDDGDGTTDESACAESRMNFVQSAARAFVDLQVDAGIDLGILQFDENNNIVRPIALLDDTNAEDVKLDIDGIFASGWTAIGDALEASKTEFAAAAAAGRSQTAFLLTDGYNNRGSDPETKVQELKDANIRVFTIPAGSAADVAGLSEIAANTGGYMVAADPVDELPAVYAELASQYSSSGLILQRTHFALQRKGKESDRERVPEHSFDLLVEKGADALVSFISGRNGKMSTWKLGVELFGPNGSYYNSSSPELTVDPYYIFFRIPNPAPGKWRLRAIPGNLELQESIALAFVENAEPRLLADVRPRSVEAGKQVRISATPVYAVEIEGDITLKGIVKRPDGSKKPIKLTRSPYNQAWSTTFSDFIGQGSYEVTLELNVGPDALPLKGESIFKGPERFPTDVVPFKRIKTLTFQVKDRKFPECHSDDCDNDGIPNKKECGDDTDKDGIPNIWDTNSDNDELPDSIEQLEDRDKNGVPDACDPQRPPETGIVPPHLQSAIDEEKLALNLICAGRIEESKKLLSTSIKRMHGLRKQLDDTLGRESLICRVFGGKSWLCRMFGRNPERTTSDNIIEKILDYKHKVNALLKQKEISCKEAEQLLGEARKLEEKLSSIFEKRNVR